MAGRRSTGQLLALHRHGETDHKLDRHPQSEIQTSIA